jgi:transcriptional antiterminator RfaH|tara:strand:+ start:2900 stop:3397 length:498 start_codon:yes stop_codon:yes gene_type:complete
MKEWYVIYTQLNKEKYLQYQIKGLNLEVYLPVYEKQISHSRKIITRSQPLFPRYLFVNFDLNSFVYNNLKKLHGLENFIKFGNEFMKIEDTVIKKIKDKEDKNGYVNIVKLFNLVEGKKYKFSNGAFKNVPGTFMGKLNDKYKFLVHMFNKELSLVLPRLFFEPA